MTFIELDVTSKYFRKAEIEARRRKEEEEHRKQEEIERKNLVNEQIIKIYY